MKGIREIKGRIKGIRKTAQITNAMQLVASSKMKASQEKATSSRSYALLLAEMLNIFATKGQDLSHPFLERREVNHRGVIVISTDRGLCGPLNSNLFRLIQEMPESTSFIPVGRKATQFLARTNRQMLGSFSVSDKCKFAEVRAVAEFAMDAYSKGTIDTLEVLFPRYLNTLTQEPRVRMLLPLANLKEQLKESEKILGKNFAGKAREDSRLVLFEPRADKLLRGLPEIFVKHHLFQTIFEAKASEHSARMVAMKNATDNASALVDELSLEYNKARQAAITQEILEIAAASASNN